MTCRNTLPYLVHVAIHFHVELRTWLLSSPCTYFIVIYTILHEYIYVLCGIPIFYKFCLAGLFISYRAVRQNLSSRHILSKSSLTSMNTAVRLPSKSLIFFYNPMNLLNSPRFFRLLKKYFTSIVFSFLWHSF